MSGAFNAWRHGYRIVRQRPFLFAVGLVHYIAYYSLPLLVGLVMRAILDRLGGTGSVWTLVAVLAGVEAARLGVITSVVRFGTVFDYGVETLLRHNVLDRLVEGPAARPPGWSSGEAVSRLRDDAAVMNAFMEAWIDMPGEMLLCVGAVAIMLSINATITLVVVSPLIAVVVVTDRLTGTIQRLRAASREAGARTLGFIADVFGAVQALRVAGAETSALQHLARLNEVRSRTWIRDSVFTASIASFSSNVSVLGLGAVLLLAAGAMQRGEFTVGDFALFASYLELATGGPRWIGRTLARRRQADVSLDRMNAMMNGADSGALTSPRRADSSRVVDGGALEELSARGLSFRYSGSEHGIELVDLSVRRGEFVAVTGRIGAGKSTLLRVLLGLVPADAGEILWNGARIDAPHRFMRPPQCAYVAQVPVLFSESLRDNIEMGVRASPDRLDRVARESVLAADIERLDAGFDTLVGARGMKLSGGQQTRAALMRALLREPQLLVLDDVSSSLDIDTERQLWDAILARRDMAVLAVVHRRDALLRADDIVVMESGRVAARGTADELLSSNPLFREIWDAAG